MTARPSPHSLPLRFADGARLDEERLEASDRGCSAWPPVLEQQRRQHPRQRLRLRRLPARGTPL
eukprot:CAMPEP_0204041452 /NCGR_PEP_ID=MMETSP0360-20130528/94529_1 /ASSEMBLY_ACC=CAM_ASM_000342 /TAXON_ID=268821 /ORGANISM="Scrippsiella Hangoei, Strain SHTV-5" /LENGTH=63 /DNA_ID=CAMNT_0050987597 /DNA_START=106 /DNA_END=294 /DNA_ORIENTATION=+